MKVLITGGCGFIGSHTAERFAKEGHSIYIIDNLSSGTPDTVKSSYKFYNIDITDKRCEEFFRIHNFDVVVHLAGRSDEDDADSAYFGSETNVLGLINMLDFSQKYGVKKFIFASSAAVYGDKPNLPVRERDLFAPVSLHGMNKSVGEYYCRKWRELHGLNTFILRLASVFGPSLSTRGAVGDIPDIMKKMVDKEDIVIRGDAGQTKDYIHVDEVSYIIYQIAVKNITETTFNVSSNTGLSFQELLEKLALLGPVKNIRYEKKSENDIKPLVLDNTLLSQQLGWSPKFTLDERLKHTYEWYQKNYSKPVAVKEKSFWREKLEIIHPYLENIAIFSILWFLHFENYASFINQKLGIDYNYIYIAVMGFLYGKKQSMLATVLAGALFTANFLVRGGDWVALIYQEQYLFHLATYLCVGVVTGFAMDNKERIIQDIKQETDNLKERHAFLEKVHLEANQIKDDLYGQIVNTDDSIGKVYSIVHKLETLEVEEVYTAAAEIIRNVMKAKSAVLYTVNKSETYLRLNTRSGESTAGPNSLKIEDYPYLKNMMNSKRVFINKSMTENCPDMAAPILYQGRVFVVVQVHNLPFGNFTLFYENLFRITTMFISDALIKAYVYSEGLREKRYIKDTNILVPAEFDKICRELERRYESSDQQVALLRILEKPDNYEGFYQKISHLFRAEDYVGLTDDGYVKILLINAVGTTVAKIQERLKNIGIIAEIEDWGEKA